MKKTFPLKLIVAILTFQLVFISPSKAQTDDERGFGNKSVNGKRIALVIGNAAYDSGIGKLKNPVNDAGDIADSLKRLGFSLVGGKAQLNLDRRQMLEQIREFGSQIRQGGVGVFYFAGHGVQVDRRNYLIPITDSLKYQEDAEYEAVDVDSVLREMEYAENALNILILDACRNNALPRKTRSTDKGLTRPREPSGVYIAFAARDGQTASENSSGRNGLYTQELLKNIETPNLRLEDIFIRTRVKVKELSKRTQEPIEYGSLDSEFYLNVNKTAAQPPTIDRNNEAVFWNVIENSTDIEDFEEYIRRVVSDEFGGIYRATAELKIFRLKKANSSIAWKKILPIAKVLLKYDEVESFSESLALVRVRIGSDNKYGFIDRTGKEIIPLKYDYAHSFSDGLAAVRLGDWSTGRYGFIDKTGKEVIPFKYDNANSFSDGLAPVRIGDSETGKYGFIDKSGKEIISFKYDFAYSFSEGLAAVRIGEYLTGKWGFVDRTGKVIIPITYDSAHIFSEGLAVVSIDDKVGFIDKTNKEIIPLKYRTATRFSQGLAAVGIKDSETSKIGYIDKTNKEITPFKYEDDKRFSEGLA